MLSIALLSLFGVIIALCIGTFWYSDKTPMGKVHMAVLGMDKLSKKELDKKIAEAMPGMPKIYAGQALLSLLTSTATVFIITMSVQNGVSVGMATGFVVANWLCFMVPAIGMGILWGNVDRALAWKKFFSDSAMQLVTILLIALVTSLFV